MSDPKPTPKAEGTKAPGLNLWRELPYLVAFIVGAAAVVAFFVFAPWDSYIPLPSL